MNTIESYPRSRFEGNFSRKITVANSAESHKYPRKDRIKGISLSPRFSRRELSVRSKANNKSWPAEWEYSIKKRSILRQWPVFSDTVLRILLFREQSWREFDGRSVGSSRAVHAFHGPSFITGPIQSAISKSRHGLLYTAWSRKWRRQLFSNSRGTTRNTTSFLKRDNEMAIPQRILHTHVHM